MNSKKVLDLVIDKDIYADWQRTLIKDPDLDARSIRQRELIAAVSAGRSECARWMLDVLQVEDEMLLEVAARSLPNPLTVGEMKGLPVQAELRLANSLNEITANEAATPVFWAACHAIWIKQGLFGDLVATFLGDSTKLDDNKVRNFLRRTGGLEPVRGKVSVLNDCRISMAWWRVRMARGIHRVAPVSGLEFSSIHALLHDNAIWEEMVSISVKRLTAINALKARAAVVLALLERDTLDKDAVTRELRKAHCRESLRAVARLSHNYSLDIVDFDKLIEAAKNGIKTADDGSSE